MAKRVTAAIAAAATAVAVVGCGGGSPGRPAGPQADPLALGPVEVVASRTLVAGAGGVGAQIVRSLPRHPAVSVDLGLAPGSQLLLGQAGSVTLERGAAGTGGISLQEGGRAYTLRARSGWPGSPSALHLELAGGHLAVNGQRLPVPAALARAPGVALVATRGRVGVQGLIVTDARRRGALLLHRLAELHARVPPGAPLTGADRRDGLHYGTAWTSGFLPGALWQAASLVPAGGLFAGWALQATLAHLGLERQPTHDVGLMYGQSSLLAWEYLCRRGAPPVGPPAGVSVAALPGVCGRLRASVLAAADELRTLASGNPGAGTIPTDPYGPVAETIVDSMMNIGILPWAGRVAHDRAYSRLASHQAHVIGSLLVRQDGSTFQAVSFVRATGRILSVGTKQGISDQSTWARGQAWALYGFAQAAQSLRDPQLLSVAQRVAGYVSRRAPTDGVPPWDYAAPTAHPLDVSAAVITAAGLMHLLSACSVLSGACGDTSGWAPLARGMLNAALRHASARPPLGLLGAEVLNGRRRTCCNGGELVFGLSYALEALSLDRKLG